MVMIDATHLKAHWTASSLAVTSRVIVEPLPEEFRPSTIPILEGIDWGSRFEDGLGKLAVVQLNHRTPTGPRSARFSTLGTLGTLGRRALFTFTMWSRRQAGLLFAVA